MARPFLGAWVVAATTALSIVEVPTKPFAYPWVVAISNSESLNGISCLGALINENWAITSAHCDIEEGFTLHANRYDIFNNNTESAEAHRIASVIRHPQYDHNTLENDIALVRICSHSKIEPTQFLDVTDVESSGEALRLVGWGPISVVDNVLQKVLHEIEVTEVTNEVCGDDTHYGHLRQFSLGRHLNEASVCIARSGLHEDIACQVTNGNPLFTGADKLVALGSWTDGCGDKSSPAVYTRLSPYRSWVRETIQNADIKLCKSTGDMVPRRLKAQVPTSCSELKSCGECAGKRLSNAGGDTYCYWCESENECIDEETWSTDETCSFWAYSKLFCPVQVVRTVESVKVLPTFVVFRDNENFPFGSEMQRIDDSSSEESFGSEGSFGIDPVFTGGDEGDEMSFENKLNEDFGSWGSFDDDAYNMEASSSSNPQDRAAEIASYDAACDMSTSCDACVSAGYATESGAKERCVWCGLDQKCVSQSTWQMSNAICGFSCPAPTRDPTSSTPPWITPIVPAVPATKPPTAAPVITPVATPDREWMPVGSASTVTSLQVPTSDATCDSLGWKTSPGSPMVCGGSNINGECISTASFLQASMACKSIGTRLCSADELSNNEAKGTGCKLDDQLVWSSTPCPGGAIVTHGSFIPGEAKKCSNLRDVFAVRCCAVQPLVTMDTWLQTCEDLQWPINENGVCAASKISGSCPKPDMYEAARDICFSAGAKLCSVYELESGVATGSGCKLDDALVWSDTPCPGGYLVQQGDGKGERLCMPTTRPHSGRCCAKSGK